MSNIVLVAETGSDITKEIARQYGIYLVPMHVTFGDKTLDDGAFPVERICEYYEKTGELPKTCSCSPSDFEKVFDEIHERWPDKHILHLAYSARTTGSYQNALAAAAERDYVTSVDTMQVSAGQAAVVIRMAQILESDPELGLKAAIDIAQAFSRNTHMCFLPDDLAYLRAGGRVSNVALLGGRILHIHPCIEIVDGLLMATKKYRGNLEKLAPRLICEYAESKRFNKAKLYLISSIGLKETVRQAAENAAKQLGFRMTMWIQTGCVITTHGGPGSFGIAGFTDDA